MPFLLIFIAGLFITVGAIAYDAKDLGDIPLAYRSIWAGLIAIGSVGFSVTLVIDGIKTDGFKAEHFEIFYIMWLFVGVAVLILSNNWVITWRTLLFSMIFNTVLVFASCIIEITKEGMNLEEGEESAACEC